MKWTKSPNQDFNKDNRGWIKGTHKKWDKTTDKKIKQIHEELEEDPYQFFTGATAIRQKWQEKYPETSPPPLRTIGKIMADQGLSSKRRKDRHQGASRYLCYPEYTIYNLLGDRILEADFIGSKHIRGRTEPLNFIGFSFKKEPKLRHYKRIQSQASEELIRCADAFFKEFERPDYIKVDNALAMIGSASGKRNISRAMKFFLDRQVIPIFAVPRKPFSQASIEGNNSVFSRKFWNRIEFQSVAEVEEKLEWFNRSSEKYLGYRQPKTSQLHQDDFIPKVYFIRQVKQDKGEDPKPSISVLNERIIIPRSYVNYFVLAKWDLQKEKLFIYFEKEQKPKLIKQISFKINPKSK